VIPEVYELNPEKIYDCRQDGFTPAREVNGPTLLTLNNITKDFFMENGKVIALKDVDLELKQGEFVSVLGPSGSGKSTLLHIMGLLSKPTQGTMVFEGETVSSLNEKRLSRFRSEKIGFVFQTFHLLGSICALENVELPLIYQRVPVRARKQRALEALEMVGMEHRIDHFPRQLSGGESQRVAIARALVNRPSLILADEPTGNLDTQTGLEILKILEKLNISGVTLVIVTHDHTIAKQAHRKVFLKDGRIDQERLS
jgi:putative ABC transport system ATP-binding protein